MKKYKKKEIKKEIMKMVINYTEEENYYKIVLKIGTGITKAHKIYESIGFNGESKRAYKILN